jgi:hypothetical protein
LKEVGHDASPFVSFGTFDDALDASFLHPLLQQSIEGTIVDGVANVNLWLSLVRAPFHSIPAA